jgi:hypothetical protein
MLFNFVSCNEEVTPKCEQILDPNDYVLSSMNEMRKTYATHHLFDYNESGQLKQYKLGIKNFGVDSTGQIIENYFYTDGRLSRLQIEKGFWREIGFWTVHENDNGRVDSIVSESNPLNKVKFFYDIVGNLEGVSEYGYSTSNDIGGAYLGGYLRRDSTFMDLFKIGFSLYGKVKQIEEFHEGTNLIPMRTELEYYYTLLPQHIVLSEDFRCVKEGKIKYQLQYELNCANLPVRSVLIGSIPECFNEPTETTYMYIYKKSINK